MSSFGPLSIVAASPNQVSCDLGGEAAILNLKSGIYYGLDSVGGRIWALLRKPRSVREIVGAITAEYDVDPDRCERDLLDLLGRLESHGLIREIPA